MVATELAAAKLTLAVLVLDSADMVQITVQITVLCRSLRLNSPHHAPRLCTTVKVASRVVGT